MSNKLKKFFTAAVYDKPAATSLTLSAILTAGFISNVVLDKPEYEIDSFSNSETISEVSNLNSQIESLNSKFIDVMQDDNSITDRLEKEKEILEFQKIQIVYDMLTSPISEEATKQIITSYNGMEIGQDFPITGLDNFENINDVKLKLEPNDNLSSFNKKLDYIDNFKERSNNIAKAEDESLGAIFTMYGVSTIILGSLINAMISIATIGGRPQKPTSPKVEPAKSNKPKRKKLKSLGV